MTLIAGMALTLPLLTLGFTGQPPATVAPDQVSLPPAPAKVLQMSEAGVSDDLILAYLRKSANSYTLSAQQIIYLHDLGVSSAVLKALVDQEASADNAPAEGTLNGTVETQNVSSETSVDVSSPPVSGAAVNFYEALAPYGTWVNVPAYGWCWRPTVEVMNTAWQPYCNNGCWMWTDQGWYWNSYYSWGWAPFHYGRWCRYQGYGWIWRPDDVWGPAWVCWRDYPGYCGWAPLPPGANFTAGLGWTFNGLSVGFNYGFGLGPRYFTFCDYDNFCSRHPFYHFRRDRDAEHYFNHSRVDNDWTRDAHHRFFDHGIDPSRIEAASHTHIRQVDVREFPRGAEHSRHFVAPDRLAQNGNSPVIYRPNQDWSAGRDHFRHDTPPAYHWSGQPRGHGFTYEHPAGASTQTRPAGSNDPQPSRPGIVPGRSGLNRFNPDRHWGGAENARETHAAPAQNFRNNFASPRQFAPAFHPAPAWHPSQVGRVAPAWHSTPAWHQSPPMWHPATPTFRQAPVFHTAPAFHSAPAFHPAQALRGAGGRFGDGGRR